MSKTLPTRKHTSRQPSTAAITSRPLPSRRRVARCFSESSTVGPTEVFSAGTHRGKTYTEADLDDIVRNFNAASVGPSATLEVPVVIGHEEKQEYLEDTGIPAAGWVKRLWRKGKKLLADIGDVPSVVTKLLRANRYKHVSAEIYDEPPQGVPGKGCTLRRIALLGGEQPQVKNLANIPLPDLHSESGFDYRPCVLKFCEIKPGATAGVFRVFSEVVPMDRDQMVQQLADMGFDVEKLKDCADEALAEILRGITAGDDDANAGGDAAAAGDDTAMSDDADADDKGMSDEDKEKFCSKYLEEMPDDKKKTFLEKYMMKNADAAGEGDDDMGATQQQAPKKVITTTAEHFSEKHLKGLLATMKQEILTELKPVQDAATALSTKVASLDKFAEDRIAADKRSRIDSEVKALVNSGHILPAEIKAGKYDYLYDLPATGTASKFSENGKQKSGSPLDAAIAKIKAGPVLTRFGEKIPGGQQSTEDAEIQAVEERFQKFSEEYARAGVTKDKLLSGFKAERKLRPTLTAKEYFAA